MGRMDYCFDTSALNRLHDDPDREAITVGLLATNNILITALNIRETVATTETARRISLMRLQRRLARGIRPLRAPIEVWREVTIARLSGRDSVTLTIEENSRELWWALEQPEELTSKLQQESYEWKTSLEEQFTEAHRRARVELQRVFVGPEKPESLGHLIRLFHRNPWLILPTVSAVYEAIAGAPLDEPGMLEVFSELPEWPLFMAIWAQGLYARALQEQGYGPERNAGTVDLWFGVYLAHCDFFITDDRAQYKALRVINRIGQRRRSRAKVLLYDQLRERLII